MKKLQSKYADIPIERIDGTIYFTDGATKHVARRFEMIDKIKHWLINLVPHSCHKITLVNLIKI